MSGLSYQSSGQPSSSKSQMASGNAKHQGTTNEQSNPYEPSTNNSTPPPREHNFTKRLLHRDDHNVESERNSTRRRSISGRRVHDGGESKTKVDGDSSHKPGLGPRPVGGDKKLGMFSGVYVPTCLNVLSILMFLRFGFILGLYSSIGLR